MSAQAPDLSNIGMPDDLPIPRTTEARVQTESEVPPVEIRSQSPTSPLQQRRHQSSLDDMAKPVERSPKGSIMTREESAAAEEMANPKNVEPPTPQRRVMSTPVASNSVNDGDMLGLPSGKIRDIRDLFTFGKVKKTKVVAGFELTLTSLSTDDYTRAWSIASVYPEGPAKEYVAMQQLLAISLTHINGLPVESFCKKTDIVDIAQRRAFVFANLDRNLVSTFFEQGYAEVNKESQNIINNLPKTGEEAAVFLPRTQN